MQYPAPGAPEEAEKVARNPEIEPDESWGLDHGSWSVLRHMYPKADVPAFQLSLDERRSFKEHLELGREIRALRERGVLILGSGNIVHNLRRIDWDEPHGAYDWAVEFDSKVKKRRRRPRRECPGFPAEVGRGPAGHRSSFRGALLAASLLHGQHG